MVSLETSEKKREMGTSTRRWGDTASAFVERSLFNEDFIPYFPLKIKENESSYVIYNPLKDCEFEVNTSAYYLLKLCDGYRTLDEISLELASMFKVDNRKILRLAKRFWRDLLKKELSGGEKEE